MGTAILFGIFIAVGIVLGRMISNVLELVKDLDIRLRKIEIRNYTDKMK